jgi:hypothetical protein
MKRVSHALVLPRQMRVFRLSEGEVLDYG